ncbi:MAG TPA: ABC transporter substrate-binding protein, partial [Acidimicrobiia bacterium]|nr:ABC transporter substrate-binding protein [Acidimicrobiia bacterium]
MITRPKGSLRIAGIAVALALAFTACGSSSKPKAGGGTTGGGKKGGALVFGAEQWPDCINPITQCGNSSWLQWLVPIHVLPRLAELDEHNNFVASPLITELPSTSNGGVTGSGKAFTVTYHLNPNAKWDDGTPITSADVKFSWRAYLDSKGSLSTTGYDKVTSVDTRDPQTAVLHFSETYSDWQDVLGGFQGVILEKAKFASTDTGKTMQTTIGFSGGPWKLLSFSKTQEVLVANKSYWDSSRIPKLDQVTFIPLTETNKEVQSIQNGTVSVVYPQPATDNVPPLKGDANLKTTFGVTTQYEALWFNEKAGKPFEDKNLREAFSFAFDRQLFLNDIVKPFSPSAQLLNCALWVPNVGNWCTNTDWSDVNHDSAKVAAAMQRSGYAKDSSGMWAKGGKELTLHWMVNTGNARREATQHEFIPLLAKEGFKVVPDNSDSDTVFQKRTPAGDYDFAMFINVASPDPSVTSITACNQIPSAANQNAGQNDYWYCNKQVDQLNAQADGDLNPTTRADEVHQIDKILRQDYYNLPLYVFPAMTSWRP